MDDTEGRRHVGSCNVLESGAGYVGESLVDVGWRSVKRRAPDQGRNSVDKLRQLSFASTHHLIGLHLLVYIVTETIPLENAPVLISQRFCPARHPMIDAVSTAQPIAQGETLAGGEA